MFCFSFCCHEAVRSSMFFLALFLALFFFVFVFILLPGNYSDLHVHIMLLPFPPFPLSSVISPHALTDMQEKLPVNLKAEIEVTFRKRLDYEFHTAGYHAMLETTTGLRTAAGHLLKV